MKFLGRDPPESSLPASDRVPSEVEGETGGAGRTFSIFPAKSQKKQSEMKVEPRGGRGELDHRLVGGWRGTHLVLSLPSG